jgi:ferrous iron transport protein A
MIERKSISLAEMEIGQSGRILGIAAGIGLSGRLQAMGIRTGKKVTKISGMVLRGPVVIQVEGTRVGLGHGMARKVMVEVSS